MRTGNFSRWRTGIVALVAAMFTGGWAVSNAEAGSKTVYLLSWGGTIQTTFEKEGWAARFKEDTGYEMVLVPKPTSSQIIATAVAQKDNPQIDVIMCDYTAWLLGKYQGIFAEIDAQSVPNLNNIYDYAPIKDDGKVIGSFIYSDTLGIIYQTDMFKKNGWAIPTGWDDLLRPELQGKVAVPPVNNTYGLYTLIHFARANGGGESNIEPGFDILKKLAPGVVDWTTTYAKLGEHMQSELVAISVFGANSGFEIMRRGIPVEVVIPDPDYLSPTAIGVAKGAPNPEGARVLMNWMLGKDFQTFRAERFGNNAMNKSVRVTGDAAKRLLTTEQMARLKVIDYETVLANRANWNERFEKEVAPIK